MNTPLVITDKIQKGIVMDQKMVLRLIVAVLQIMMAILSLFS